MTKKISAKITKIKRRAGFTSLLLKIVHHYRDFAGRPRYKIVASFPTIRSTEVADRNVQKKFWASAEETFERLKAENYYFNDMEAIRKAFAEVVPVPVALPLPKYSVPTVPKTTLSDLSARFPLIRD